ncbi:Hypothetical Protein RradSPS_0463 [Rubrobacter radiotolerans]|uniref:Uncharacterized protein n=1 Tax=Rubrobacter radiotolerans TaxID=42256 RepID=A0A023X0K4_RUBRA|nr:Hypothetical Protein RradSPS_0463 [Rubrobacter radiotolerans]
MCFGVAGPEWMRREFAGFGSVEGGVRGFSLRPGALFSPVLPFYDPSLGSNLSAILAV